MVGRPDARRLCVRARCRLENNIKVAVQEVDWGHMNWIAVAQDRDIWRAVVNAVMKVRVP